jgi:hypothetical protein
MDSFETAPAVDKILHADGSVTTSAGKEILPADPSRAKEYENRAAFADKWLRPDGSVVDMTGRVILEADENRARDYESRMASAGVIPGGGVMGSASVAMFDSTLTYLVPRADAVDEIGLPNVFVLKDDENNDVTCLIRTAGASLDDTFHWDVFPFNDTATAVLI